jgi:hypothetical protein
MGRLTPEIQKSTKDEITYGMVTERKANGVYIIQTRDGKKFTAYNDTDTTPNVGDGVVVSKKSPTTIIGKRRIQNTAKVFNF